MTPAERQALHRARQRALIADLQAKVEQQSAQIEQDKATIRELRTVNYQLTAMIQKQLSE